MGVTSLWFSLWSSLWSFSLTNVMRAKEETRWEMQELHFTFRTGAEQSGQDSWEPWSLLRESYIEIPRDPSLEKQPKSLNYKYINKYVCQNMNSPVWLQGEHGFHMKDVLSAVSLESCCQGA